VSPPRLAATIAADIRAGRTTARAETEAALVRIEAGNGAVNAFTDIVAGACRILGG